MKGKTKELKNEIPTSENTITGGNQVSVPLFPRTNQSAIVVSPATRQAPIFFRSEVGAIFSFAKYDAKQT